MWIDPPQFFNQIKGAGYQPRTDDLRLTLTGQLNREGGRLTLAVHDVKPGPQTLVLVKGSSREAKEDHALAHAYEQASGKAGQAVEIEGWWRPAKGKGENATPPSLIVIRVAPAGPAKPATTAAGQQGGELSANWR